MQTLSWLISSVSWWSKGILFGGSKGIPSRIREYREYLEMENHGNIDDLFGLCHVNSCSWSHEHQFSRSWMCRPTPSCTFFHIRKVESKQRNARHIRFSRFSVRFCWQFLLHGALYYWTWCSRWFCCFTCVPSTRVTASFSVATRLETLDHQLRREFS